MLGWERGRPRCYICENECDPSVIQPQSNLDVVAPDADADDEDGVGNVERDMSEAKRGRMSHKLVKRVPRWRHLMTSTAQKHSSKKEKGIFLSSLDHHIMSSNQVEFKGYAVKGQCLFVLSFLSR